MTRKEKFIAWAGVIFGAIIGTGIGYYLANLTIGRLIFAFFACFGILALAVPCIGVLIEIRNEERANANRSYPANWGYDRTLEN